MMLNPLPLSPGACLQKYWAPPADLNFLSERRLLPLHGEELKDAAGSMPIAAVNIANRWRLMAICGVSNGQNVFIHRGQWLGDFRPACLETLPFDSLTLGNKGVVAFDRASNLEVGAVSGKPFFTAEGELHISVLPYFERLKERYTAYKNVENALMLLDKLDLLVPWTSCFLKDNPFNVAGLYMVDEERISKLSDIDFLALRNANAFAVAYALNISLQQVKVVSGLSLRQEQRAHHAPDEPILR